MSNTEIKGHAVKWHVAPAETTHFDPTSHGGWVKVVGDKIWHWSLRTNGWVRSTRTVVSDKAVAIPVTDVVDKTLTVAQPEIDWSTVPAGATHFDPSNGMSYRLHQDVLLYGSKDFQFWYKPRRCHGLPESAVARPAPSEATHYDPVKEVYVYSSPTGLFVWSPLDERWLSAPELTLGVNVQPLRAEPENSPTAEDWDRGEARIDIIGPNGNDGAHYPVTEEQLFPCEGYEKLHSVYRDAHHHAAYQKGAERHANDLPFHEQRMQSISEGLDTPHGMAFQVVKKVQEGLQMEDYGACRRELLGALNYLAGIVIFLDNKNG